MPTPTYTGKEGRLSVALSSVATGLGLRKNVVGTKAEQIKKSTEKKPDINNAGAKIIQKTSIMPNTHNTSVPSSSSMPTQSLTNQTGPSSKSLSTPKTKRKSRSKSTSSSKTSIKPKGILVKEADVGGSRKQLKLTRSKSTDHKVNSSSGQKLVKNKKIVVKKKISSHPRTSSSTSSGNKTKSKNVSTLATGSVKRKIKPKKKRALTIVSTVVKPPQSTPETCDQSKNENVTSEDSETLHEKELSPSNIRIRTRAPLENALIEALLTTNVDQDDTLRVRGGSVNNQPYIFGTKDVPNTAYYAGTSMYNKNVNGDIDLRALLSDLPKFKKNSSEQNQNTAPSGNSRSKSSPSASSTGSRETRVGTSSTQRNNPQTSKDDEDPNKKKKDTADKKDEENGQSSSNANRKRVTFSCVDTPFIINNNTDFQYYSNKKVVRFNLEPWQKVNHKL